LRNFPIIPCSAREADACSMVNLVRLLMKPHLLSLLQDNCWLGSLSFLAQVVWMREEYNSVLSTPTEADKIGYFGRCRYIGKTQISARPTYRSISSQNLYERGWWSLWKNFEVDYSHWASRSSVDHTSYTPREPQERRDQCVAVSFGGCLHGGNTSHLLTGSPYLDWLLNVARSVLGLTSCSIAIFLYWSVLFSKTFCDVFQVYGFARTSRWHATHGSAICADRVSRFDAVVRHALQ